MKSTLLVTAGLLFGALATTCAQHQGHGQSNAAPAPAVPAAPTPAFGRAGDTTMADVASRVVPSVVNISATKVVRRRMMRSPFMDDPFFRHFFGPQAPMPSEQRQKSLGSGVIVSADGVILTNNHVVEQTEEIRVSLSDGRTFNAKVIGTDPKSDVAVIRLQGKPKNLTPIKIGSSAALRLGEVVLAIGNPFGVGQTVTMGIVSATGRSRMGIVDYEDFIQTDAAINPGNSGGALVNMRGELVGINTAILSRSGGYQGIGFAIPADMAKPIMKSLLDNGKVERGWLGVSIQDLTPDLARGLGIGTNRGVLISGVVDDSPAEKAGLKRGDVVVGLNGKAINSTAVFRNRIAALGPRATAKLTVMRGARRTTIEATLGSLASHDGAAGNDQVDKTTKGLMSGVSIANLSPQTRQRYDIDESVTRGVVVTAVEPGSAVARAGVRPGDVILQVNRKSIGSVAELGRAYDAKASSLVLLIGRGDATLYVVIRK